MYRMTRRNVIATLAGSSATLLGPAILSAQDNKSLNIPNYTLTVGDTVVGQLA